MRFPTGALIGGRYRLDGLIGSGGMGEVFRAHDIVLARDVAVKLVEAVDPRRRDEITRSFLREARISAALAHRNVVQILDFGTHEGAVPFMVMELLKGESLADILGRGEALSFEWILTIANEVLDGLSVAHEQGVVHRDLKPENIFLAETASGVHPKVLDFGISKILDASGSATITTTQGHVVGTPAYMSPEQARGIKVIDKRTDVYSMGVVLYELLSGEMPFFSENPGDLLIMIITEEAQPLHELIPDVGPELSAIVERAMAKDPDARFADAQALQRALLAAADRLLGTEASRRLGERARPPSWRKRATTDGRADSDALTVVAQMSTVPPRPVRSPLPRKRPPPSRLRGYVVAAGAAFLAGAIGGAAIWLGRSNAASSQPRVIVVSADSADSVTPRTVRNELSGSAPQVTSMPEEQPRVEPAEAKPANNQPAQPASRAPRDTASELAESFRRQKADVVLCVNEHADVVEHTPKLGVRFTLSTDGSVVQAEVSPAGVATTPLGTCIRKAAQAMRFPKQTAPISFEVPLTARKGT